VTSGTPLIIESLAAGAFQERAVPAVIATGVPDGVDGILGRAFFSRAYLVHDREKKCFYLYDFLPA